MRALISALFSVCLLFAAPPLIAEDTEPMIQSLSPILPMDRIEPSIAFFEKVGFSKTTDVPEDDHLGFAIMESAGFEVMLQTKTGMSADADALGLGANTAPIILFVTVPDLSVVEAALEGEEIVMPKRETFYGSTEIAYREPGGHIISFAEFKPED